VGTICAGTIYKDKAPGNSPENSRGLGSYGFADLEHNRYTTRGAARCLLHVLGRSVKTDSCGRIFAVLSTQVSAVGLRLRHIRLACGTFFKLAATLPRQEKNNSSLVQRSRENIALSVQ
jgi:hypothetical protein